MQLGMWVYWPGFLAKVQLERKSRPTKPTWPDIAGLEMTTLACQSHKFQP